MLGELSGQATHGRVNKPWFRLLPRRSVFLTAFAATLALVPAARGQWYGGPPWSEGERIRLSLYGGWFRISHSQFEDYYDSRWGFAPSGAIRVRVKGVRALLGIRQFRQKLNGRLHSKFPDAGSKAWNQRVWNLGVRLGGNDGGKIRSASYFGLCYHEVEERAQPFITDKSKSTTLGFFILLESEYMILPRVGLGWAVELSSAAPGRSAAFEANSIGGVYLGAALHVHLF